MSNVMKDDFDTFLYEYFRTRINDKLKKKRLWTSKEVIHNVVNHAIAVFRNAEPGSKDENALIEEIIQTDILDNPDVTLHKEFTLHVTWHTGHVGLSTELGHTDYFNATTVEEVIKHVTERIRREMKGDANA